MSQKEMIKKRMEANEEARRELNRQKDELHAQKEAIEQKKEELDRQNSVLLDKWRSDEKRLKHEDLLEKCRKFCDLNDAQMEKLRHCLSSLKEIGRTHEYDCLLQSLAGIQSLQLTPHQGHKYDPGRISSRDRDHRPPSPC